ncbi:nitroreductase/quinone reductase family protein [Kineococcus sp. GCM10028916]|uniref:nitroreductase/quinone reductase family protein n=1 Tax=unclassified Kineococcus TaxID=2621656 RepID=UPI00363097EB
MNPATGSDARPPLLPLEPGPARRRRRPAYLAPTNAVVKTLSRWRVSTGVIKVLTVPGRTSGKPRSTPVSPLSLDGRRFILAPTPEGDWARNARAAGRGTLTDGPRSEQVLLRELDRTGEADLRRRLMTSFPAAVPDGVRLFKALDLVTSADPAQFAAAADLVTAFEVLPAPGT